MKATFCVCLCKTGFYEGQFCCVKKRNRSGRHLHRNLNWYGAFERCDLEVAYKWRIKMGQGPSPEALHKWTGRWRISGKKISMDQSKAFYFFWLFTQGEIKCYMRPSVCEGDEWWSHCLKIISHRNKNQTISEKNWTNTAAIVLSKGLWWGALRLLLKLHSDGNLFCPL